MCSYTRIETYTIYYVGRVKTLGFGIGIKLIKVGDTECQIGIGKSFTASASVKPIKRVSMLSLSAPCFSNAAKRWALSSHVLSHETIIRDGYRLSYSAFDSLKNSGLNMILFVWYFFGHLRYSLQVLSIL